MSTLRTIVLAAAVLLTHAAAPAQVIPPPGADMKKIAPGTEFLDLSFEEGVKRAVAEHRLLLVYLYDPREPETAVMNSTTWQNPTLAAYIRWHCVPIKVSTTLRELGGVVCPRYQNRRGALDPFTGKLPAVRVYKGRDLVACIPTVKNTMGQGAEGIRSGVCPPATNILFQTDFAMDRIRATDPAWAMLHDRYNPMPEAPPMPGPFYLHQSDLGAAIEDPRPDELHGGSVWDRLESARRAVRAGDLHYATGLYTWLWERGVQVDPAFGPARRSFVAAEIADLARRRPGAMERFQAIRDGHSARMLWADYDEIREWTILNSVVADNALTVEYFDLFINDRDEAAMLPPAMKSAYEMMLARADFADPHEMDKDPAGRLDRLAGFLRRPKPVLVAPEDWEPLRTLARNMLLEEGCRLHAACLGAGRESDAERIARTLTTAIDTAEARRALVTTAIVAGHARPLHRTLLDEADAAAAPDAELRRRLEAMLQSTVHKDVRGGTDPAPAPSPSTAPPSRRSPR